jgi:quinolinate synthase
MNNLSIKENKEKILKLEKEKGALILTHYYQNLEIQHVADFCGDSFELAKIARTSDKEIIVFCGVSFMAESAKIMNPEKRVFIPRNDVGCLMADMVSPGIVLEMKKEHPDAAVVCYINSSADTKAVCDICVTSSNAIKVVGTLEEKEIIFIPDRNLGSFVKEKFPEKTFYFMEGCCPVHHDLSESDILLAKEKYPDAAVVIHPECKKELLRHGDCIGSTSAILDYCRESDKKEFLVGTERAIAERLSEEFPEKKFHLISPCLVCPDMKKTTLDDLLYTLENFDNEIVMTEEKMRSARLPLERMLEAAAKN